MGLDMYVYRTKAAIPDVDFERPEDCDYDKVVASFGGNPEKFNSDDYERYEAQTRVWYWRKHPNLHGWFKALWAKKGGKPASDHFGDDFNGGNPVRIVAEDLDALEKDLAANLPFTQGFFFGESYGDELEDDRRFVAKARTELALGNNLFYVSSW